MPQEYSADTIAKSFVKQFYKKFAEAPHELFKFYLNDASFTHCSSHEEIEPCNGIDAINKKISELSPQLVGSSFDLSKGFIDSHYSEARSVLIVVTGMFTANNEGSRPFVQTFFLTSQSSDPLKPAYFVRNSILRLMDVAAPAPVLINTAVEAVYTPVVESIPEPIPEIVKVFTPPEPEVVVVEKDVVAIEEPIVVEPTPEPVVVKEEVKEIVHVAVAEPAPVVVLSGTKSWADVMKKPATSPVVLPVVAKQASTRAAATTTTTTTTSEASKVITPAAKVSTNSLYVKLIPADCKKEAIVALFSKFGPVTNADINSEKGFAFVDFENADGVQAVLACTEPISINNIVLKVEARNSSKPSVKNGSGSGRSNRNRGGSDKGNSDKGGDKKGDGHDNSRRQNKDRKDSKQIDNKSAKK